MKVINGSRPLSFLVVDDEIPVCELHRSLCNFLLPGMEFVAVTSGLEALNLLKERQFDFLVTDCLMPGMSGFELLELIGLDSPIIKVVFSGSVAMGKSYARARQLGAIIIAQKPDAMSLWRQIQQICSK